MIYTSPTIENMLIMYANAMQQLFSVVKTTNEAETESI